jgi:hypothetical protein
MDNQLSKSCLSCGLQKPLSAFLQITGPEGSSYGNICSTCRGSGLGKKITIVEVDDDHVSSSTGLKIDGKAKQQIDRVKKLKAEEKVAVEHKEELKDENEKQEKSERKEIKASEEKKHRENFIDVKKKESFLNYQSKKPADSVTKTAQQKQLNQAHSSDLDRLAQTDIENKQAGAKSEDLAKNVDLGNTFVDTVTGEIKYHSAEFLKMRAKLGNSAAINTIERQFLARKTSHMENPDKADRDTLAEFVEEKWQPNSPKSRR